NDMEALWKGLRDGTIDAIATDHAPHTRVDKECEYSLAAFGISALETALPMLLFLSHRNIVDLSTAISALTCNPARILGLPQGTLQIGRPADIVIFDPEEEWTITTESLASKGKNTPLLGIKLRGRVRWTLLQGEVIWGPKPIPGQQYQPPPSNPSLQGWLLGTSDLIEP
ncbi:MAG: amidohydrolase family protein, partial [Chloroflexia bacterium]|nr:amidohydrolase family protein [Chloroflexia bacterium]